MSILAVAHLLFLLMKFIITSTSFRFSSCQCSVSILFIDHTFIHCSFTKSFVQKVTLWFNTTNNSQISPTTEELLFGINTYSSGNNNAIKKFNYTTLFMRYYIYSSKLNNKPISLNDFINVVQERYMLENSCN